MLGPWPSSLGGPQILPLLSSLGISPGRPWLGGKLPEPIRTDTEKLPFHYQCGQHLWLQDLLPTVGALLDPSEMPLRTDKKREGKTRFSQEKREVGESGTCPVPYLETQVPGTGCIVPYGQTTGGVPYYHPLTAY